MAVEDARWQDEADGTRKLVGKDNRYVTGWVSIDGKWYFMDKNGVLTTNRDGLVYPQAFYLHQTTSVSGTFFAATNLLRSKAFIDGKDYQAVG